MNREQLFGEFKKCFPDYDEKRDFKYDEKGSWIFAVADRDAVVDDKAREGFHYELISRGRNEFYIELHFELYKYQWPDMRNALVKVLGQEAYHRDVLSTSYYSSLIWRVRRPVFEVAHIHESVDILRNAVDAAIKVASTDTNGAIKTGACVSPVPIKLPCPCAISVIAQMLIDGSTDENKQDKTCNRLVIPSVQRGKVWNAARIEALWDSIFRNIPIGALSVRNRSLDAKAYDLLDGQQRATAIALGYDNFPDDTDTRKFDSILWIDLKKRDDGRHEFHVTTASQPWGYADSSNETRNQLLPHGERRMAFARIKPKLKDRQIKPYPYQLYPVRAQIPVPYTVLREYVEKSREEKQSFCLAEFKEHVQKALTPERCCWIELLGEQNVSKSDFLELCEKILSVSKDYTVLLLDANSVSDDDIALYFTRIGRGGVVPSDEELAYSMLKSKLGELDKDEGWFRKKIEDLHTKFGLASSSRIAHLAIRCFKSKDGNFFTESPFSAVVKLCEEENASDRTSFCEFVRNDLEKIMQGVKEKFQLTKWHSSRYASQRNGDVYLMLMIAWCSPTLFGTIDVRGLAELIFGYSSHTDYAIKKILSEGVVIAIAKLLGESHYSSRRLTEPISANVFKSITEQTFTTMQSVIDWKAANEQTSMVIAEGYGNSPNARAYHVLIYACRNSEANHRFDYDLEQDVWTEENRPWDYDHIMPHSIIEGMPSSTEPQKKDKSVCEWLKNSIGNLAPLPFSVNRSLSDSVRDASYPSREHPDEAGYLCVDGWAVAGMWIDGRINPLKFALTTIRRFSCIYSQWYDDLSIGSLFDFKRALEQTPTSIPAGAKPVMRRYSIMTAIKKEMEPIFTFKHIVTDNKESDIAVNELHKMFCGADLITLSCDINGLAVAIVRHRSGGNWKVGFRKGSDDSETKDEVLRKVKEMCEGQYTECLDKNKLCKGNTWWYWCEELPDMTEKLGFELKSRIDKLLHFAKKLS